MNSQDKLRPREMVVGCSVIGALMAETIWGEVMVRWLAQVVA